MSGKRCEKSPWDGLPRPSCAEDGLGRPSHAILRAGLAAAVALAFMAGRFLLAAPNAESAAAPAGPTTNAPAESTPQPAAKSAAASRPDRRPREARGYLARHDEPPQPRPYVPLAHWRAAPSTRTEQEKTRGAADDETTPAPATRNTVKMVSHRPGAQAPDEEEVPVPERPARRSSLEMPPAGSAVPEPERYELIDLPAAWRLALAANPQLGSAREALNEALALARGANAIALPHLNAGLMYHFHSGVLQASFGQIRKLDEVSLYVGGGSRTLAAETLAVPAIQFFHHLGDVIYEPLAARQQVTFRRFNSTATANSVLLETSLAYLELVAAEARLDALRQTEIEGYGVARITRAYADAGLGREADAVRAHVEALLIHTSVQRGEENVALASARLAQVLNLDPSVRLRTTPGPLPALRIVDPSASLAQLLEQARQRHPLLAARSAAVAMANTRLRQEQTRPFLPLVMVGMSAGGFGGTGNFPPQSQFGQLPFSNLGNRADFDVFAVWSLQNLGLGNITTIRQRRAVLNQSIGESTKSLNDIRDEVAESYAQAQAQLQKIAIARRQLDDAEDGYVKDLKRLRERESEHPIELTNLVELVSSARQVLIGAIVGYNEAQFRLWVATGLSPLRAAGAVAEAPPGEEVVRPPRAAEEKAPPPPPPLEQAPDAERGRRGES